MLTKPPTFRKRFFSWIYRHWIISISFLLLCILAFFAWYFVIGPSRGLEGKDFDTSNNAVWLDHAWVSDDKSISDISQLVSTLGDHHIRYVFVHVGPIEPNGKISPDRFPNAKRFLDIAHIYTDKIQFQAWMGQVRNKIDLKDPLIRKNIADTANLMVTDIGFHGVHFDIEPVWDGDMEFISLLRETRERLPAGKDMSVALAEMIPEFVLNSLSPFMTFKNYNTEKYYRQVLDSADGVAVMTYESGLQKSWLYAYFVKNQVIWTTRLLDGKEKKIWIGIPTYEKGDSFDPQSENITTGLQGIIEGLNNTRSNVAGFLGVALYAYWETDAEEWQTYNTLWLGK